MDKIGRYEIIGKLGQGAFGMVYRGRDPSINRLVAIKVVSDALVGDPAQLARFQREAEAAGSLNHRNIVTIYELGEHDGRPFIAMEYLEGQDLASILAKNMGLPIEQQIDVIIQVAEGLHYAHQRGVVHRDIKPGNIRLLEDGTAKIMDFGIARTADSNMTNTGLILGTVNYMAPEMLQGQPIDARADQFSLGVTGYELLVRRRPFPGETISTVLYRIVHEKAPELVELKGSVYPIVGDIVMRCLEKDPNRRWPNCQALAQALREQVSPRSPSVSFIAPAGGEMLPTQALDSSGGIPHPASGGLSRAGPASSIRGVDPPTMATPSDGVGAGARSTALAPAPGSRRGVWIGLAAAALAAAVLAGYRLARAPGAPAERAGSFPATPPPATPTPEGEPDRDAGGAASPRLAALLEEAAAAEGRGDPETALTRYLAVLAIDPQQPVAAVRVREIEARQKRLGELKSSIAAGLGAGDRAAAAAGLEEAEKLAPGDPELRRMRDELHRLEAAAAAARPGPAGAPEAAGGPKRETVTPPAGERSAAVAAALRPLLAADPIDPAAIERRIAELRRVDPRHPLVAEAEALVRGLARAAEAIAGLNPDGAQAALAGLDPRSPAVKAARQRAEALAERHDRAAGDLARARSALDAGRAEDAAKLAQQASRDWPPLSAEAERVIERARRPAPTAPPSAPPTPPPAAPATPVRGPGDERAAIERTLERYSRAMRSKDMRALKAVWPRLAAAKEKTIADSFNFSRQHEVELQVSEVKLSGDTATVTCRRSDRIETNDGQRVENQSQAIFELHRAGEGWEIVDLR